MDDDTADAILQLQIDDLQHLITTHNGSDDQVATDQEVTATLQLEELERRRDFLADARMTRSIRCAVQDDGAIVTNLLCERRDRNLTPGEDDDLARYEAFNRDFEDMAASFNEAAVSFSEAVTQESSADQEIIDQGLPQECTACSELEISVIKVPCEHYYCAGCLRRLFRDAMTDETLFPVRCCNHEIPLCRVRHFFSADLITQFERKAVEYTTSDRTYCANATCREFIDPAPIEDTCATCTACDQSTCSLCKREVHDGLCPPNPEMDQLLETARLAGWRRCFQCRTMVELDVGCNHIT